MRIINLMSLKNNILESSNFKLRIFSTIVVIYMLFALTWWSVLLYNKVNIIYALKLQIDPENVNLGKEFFRQRVMIIGEGIVFALSLILGIYFINRAFKREMTAAKQQKNFILSVTHELKSPITAIKLILETFKKRKLSEDLTIQLSTDALEETERLHKLVEDLLISAKVSANYTLPSETFDLNMTINSLVDQFKKKYPNYNINYNVVPENLFVISNESSIYLMLSNLLENAVKYSGDNRKINVKSQINGNFIKVSVEDYGIGIPDDEKNKIFEQFYRIGDEITRASKGTGLGLYLVRKLGQKLGIKITLKDNTPNGSIFELLIPQNSNK